MGTLMSCARKMQNLGAHSCGSKEPYVRPKWGPDASWEGGLLGEDMYGCRRKTLGDE